MVEQYFSFMEERMQIQENKLDISLNQNEMQSSLLVTAYLVLASILGIFITSSSLVLLRVGLEIYNQ